MTLKRSTLVAKLEIILKLKINKEFWGKGHSPLNPLCPLPQNEKQNLILFKSDLHSQIKEKHIHQLTTRYPVTALPRAFTQIFFRFATENFGYR